MAADLKRTRRWEDMLRVLRYEMEEANGEGEAGRHEDKLETLVRFAHEEASARVSRQAEGTNSSV